MRTISVRSVKRLGDVMPESHRALMRDRLTRSLRQELGALMQYEEARPGRPTAEEAARFGAEHAQRAVADLSERLADAEAHYAANPGSEPPLSPHEQEFLADLKTHQAVQRVQETLADLQRFRRRFRIGDRKADGQAGAARKDRRAANGRKCRRCSRRR